MKAMINSLRYGSFMALAAAAILAQGCARTSGAQAPVSNIEQKQAVRPKADSASAQARPDTSQEAPYDLEEEMLQEDKVEKKTEKIDLPVKAAADSFTVTDLAEDTAGIEKSTDYVKGYRIQVFASQDAAKAREIKKSVIEGTGLAVYIDLEDGLYKVRVGDFHSREKAAEARGVLASSYPDCWIVESTVRK